MRILSAVDAMPLIVCGWMLRTLGFDVAALRRPPRFLQSCSSEQLVAFASYLLPAPQGALPTEDDILLEEAGNELWPDAAVRLRVLFSPTALHSECVVTSDLVDYAIGGYAQLIGDPDRTPLRTAGSQPALVAGLTGAISILAALLAPSPPARLTVSTDEAMWGLHQYDAARFTHNGVVKGRLGNRPQDFLYPGTLLRCRDGWVCMIIVTPGQWEGFCLAIGRPDLLDDPRYASGPLRWDNADALDEVMLPIVSAWACEDLMHVCQELFVPCGIVAAPEQVLDDPQLEARGFWTARPDGIKISHGMFAWG